LAIKEGNQNEPLTCCGGVAGSGFVLVPVPVAVPVGSQPTAVRTAPANRASSNAFHHNRTDCFTKEVHNAFQVFIVRFSERMILVLASLRLLTAPRRRTSPQTKRRWTEFVARVESGPPVNTES
jgi:hypothetical protein